MDRRIIAALAVVATFAVAFMAGTAAVTLYYDATGFYDSEEQ